ncbi:MAG TPA: DUF4136 domain-containing protein [Sedimentisphaerales bacterium]|nr:DUF4136 domain-containing protein [Sedimentisphaerales bacterium]
MKRLCLILAALSCLTAGCARSYTVRVNGFLERGLSVPDKAAIYLAVDANSHNPIFQKEIKGKIEQLLARRGFSHAAKEDVADYRLDFAFGINRREVTGFEPYYGPASSFGFGGYRRYYYGYGSYVPYAETYHDQWLTIRLSDTGRRNAADKGKVVWVGEAATTRYSADLRQNISYLLVGIFEYFGQDTRKQVAVTIDQSDPRIMRILQAEHQQ